MGRTRGVRGISHLLWVLVSPVLVAYSHISVLITFISCLLFVGPTRGASGGRLSRCWWDSFRKVAASGASRPCLELAGHVNWVWTSSLSLQGSLPVTEELHVITFTLDYCYRGLKCQLQVGPLTEVTAVGKETIFLSARLLESCVAHRQCYFWPGDTGIFNPCWGRFERHQAHWHGNAIFLLELPPAFCFPSCDKVWGHSIARERFYFYQSRNY